MKFYCGIPADGASPQQAVIIDGGKVLPIGDGLTWNGKTDPNCNKLAKAILLDAMGYEGLRYATRFRWRMDSEWQPNKYWRLDVEKVKKICEQIEQTWDESAPMRARVSREGAPIESERGPGIEWDRTDEHVRNDPSKARYRR